MLQLQTKSAVIKHNSHIQGNSSIMSMIPFVYLNPFVYLDPICVPWSHWCTLLPFVYLDPLPVPCSSLCTLILFLYLAPLPVPWSFFYTLIPFVYLDPIGTGAPWSPLYTLIPLVYLDPLCVPLIDPLCAPWSPFCTLIPLVYSNSLSVPWSPLCTLIPIWHFLTFWVCREMSRFFLRFLDFFRRSSHEICSSWHLSLMPLELKCFSLSRRSPVANTRSTVGWWPWISRSRSWQGQRCVSTTIFFMHSFLFPFLVCKEHTWLLSSEGVTSHLFSCLSMFFGCWFRVCGFSSDKRKANLPAVKKKRDKLHVSVLSKQAFN